MRAEADAELALALARSEDEKAEARGAIDKVKKLKESALSRQLNSHQEEPWRTT